MYVVLDNLNTETKRRLLAKTARKCAFHFDTDVFILAQPCETLGQNFQQPGEALQEASFKIAATTPPSDWQPTKKSRTL